MVINQDLIPFGTPRILDWNRVSFCMTFSIISSTVGGTAALEGFGTLEVLKNNNPNSQDFLKLC